VLGNHMLQNVLVVYIAGRYKKKRQTLVTLQMMRPIAVLLEDIWRGRYV
jgi:hypothetical protein